MTQPEPIAVPDLPISFGYKCVWYAVAASDTDAIVNAIQLSNTRPSTWTNGVEQAYEESVFVCPPIKGWTFIVGLALRPPSNDSNDEIRLRLEKLSTVFGTALFFATHRVVELHIWAKAVSGLLIRGYGYIGESGETIWNEGEMTNEERELGFKFFDPSSPEANEDDYWDREDFRCPSEGDVMDIARMWSVCPGDLDEFAHELGPSLGVLGSKSDFLSMLTLET